MSTKMMNLTLVYLRYPAGRLLPLSTFISDELQTLFACVYLCICVM
jgi:hypothetical protein